MSTTKRNSPVKLKLGTQTFKVNRIKSISQKGHSLAHVPFLTGNGIIVFCKVPDEMRFTYPGTYQQLKAFIEKHK